MKRTTAIPRETMERLLAAEPWTAYTAASRLGVPPAAAPVATAQAPAASAAAAARLEELRKASVASPLVRGLVSDLGAWPGKAISSHKSAEQLFHKLMLAAELGLRRGDPGADAIAAKVMKHRSAEGPFGLQMNINPAHGGTGENLWAWALCDIPVTLRALALMGWASEPAFAESVDYLAGLERPEGGWPCAVSKSLGSFRGPGKKSDPCPYATLAMLELLLDLPERRASPAVGRAADCLLGLWERSRDDHPYIFYMGTDFRKLKAPLVWYDLLHVLEALTKVRGLEKDKRLADMLDVLEAKAGPELLFTPESVYQTWKGYDWGQKKEPSPYLSAIALGILVRSGRLIAQEGR